jgi:CxxC motif-containing protein (DUF1111 family)
MHNKSWLWFAAGLLVIGTLGAAQGPQFGQPLAGLPPDVLALFEAGQEEFEAAADVGKGLGPVFNDVSCVACHSNPKVGGDSNITETRFGRITKGAFDPMTERGGSLLQVRGVDPGRGCGPEIVPPEATIIAKRKTTSLFGLGLVDNVPDTTFLDIARAQQARTPEVAGQPSIVKDVTSGRHRLGRFGWKAQVATLMTFAADAYLNEMGITSPTFPKKNLPNGDASRLEQCNGLKSDPEDNGDAVAAFTDFMMFLAPPPRGPITAQVTAGQAVFDQIGCASCHVRALTTGPNAIAALDRVRFEPFSDFLLHDMGSLGDSIEQGAAGGRQMRTAPLWGLRVRTTYLHDGRASSVEAAILAHDGQGRGAMREYTHLDDAGKRALRAFLQSL